MMRSSSEGAAGAAIQPAELVQPEPTPRLMTAHAFLQALNNAVGGDPQRKTAFAARVQSAVMDFSGPGCLAAPLSIGAAAGALTMALLPDTLSPHIEPVANLTAATVVGYGLVTVVDINDLEASGLHVMLRRSLAESIAFYLQCIRQRIPGWSPAPDWRWEVGEEGGEVAARLSYSVGDGVMVHAVYGRDYQAGLENTRRIAGPVLAEALEVAMAISTPEPVGSPIYAIQSALAAQEAAAATKH